MILSVAPAVPLAILAGLAIMAYLLASLPWARTAASAAGPRWTKPAMPLAWLLQAGVLALGAWGDGEAGMRIGFAPVLAFTLWLVLGVYAVEGHFMPLAGPRRVLALCGALSVLLVAWFPGELHAVAHSRWAPLHWVLGLASYGLFGVAVLHALMLDAAEQRLRRHKALNGPAALGMPLLRLERLTFRFVDTGFAVLTVALLLGVASGAWRWDHKTVLSLLGWSTLAALIVGRWWRGWRGRQATRWLYAGTLLLLLAYVGSRFVLEVILQRAAVAA